MNVGWRTLCSKSVRVFAADLGIAPSGATFTSATKNCHSEKQKLSSKSKGCHPESATEGSDLVGRDLLFSDSACRFLRRRRLSCLLRSGSYRTAVAFALRQEPLHQKLAQHKTVIPTGVGCVRCTNATYAAEGPWQIVRPTTTRWKQTPRSRPSSSFFLFGGSHLQVRHSRPPPRNCHSESATEGSDLVGRGLLFSGSAPLL